MWLSATINYTLHIGGLHREYHGALFTTLGLSSTTYEYTTTNNTVSFPQYSLKSGMSLYCPYRENKKKWQDIIEQTANTSPQ